MTDGNVNACDAQKALYVLWVIDLSNSMQGESIGAVNHALRSFGDLLASECLGHSKTVVFMRVMQFSDGAKWLTPGFVAPSDFVWSDLQPSGFSDLGAAYDALAELFPFDVLPDDVLPPLVILVSDGLSTDEYELPWLHLSSLAWFSQAKRFAICLGEDCDDAALLSFAGSSDNMLTIDNCTGKLMEALDFFGEAESSQHYSAEEWVE